MCPKLRTHHVLITLKGVFGDIPCRIAMDIETPLDLLPLKILLVAAMLRVVAHAVTSISAVEIVAEGIIR